MAFKNILVGIGQSFKEKARALHNINYLLINCAFGILISLMYLKGTSFSFSLSYLYVLISLVLQISLVYSFVYLLFLFIPRFLYPFLMPLVFTLLGLFLFIDTQIYSFFKFHFNSLVLNVLVTPGGWSTLGITNTQLFLIGLFVLFFIAVEFYLFKKIFNKTQPKIRVKRFAVVLLVSYILGLFVFAAGDLYDTYAITRVYNIVPTYQPLTIKRAFQRVFGYLPTPDVSFNMTQKSNLNYPRTRLDWGDVEQKYNFIFIIIDSFQMQAFNEEVTPELFKFAQKSYSFNNHYSGGNGTRHGIFSLFYGIYTSYWDAFLRENKPPIFLDRIQDLGYDTRILSTTRLTFPEFRKTVFVKFNDSIKDNYGNKETYIKDTEVLKDLSDYALNETKPFFAFAFLDGAHATYSFPDQQAKFQPYSADVNYVSLSDEKVKTEYKNRYRNSLYYLDSKIGDVLKQFEDKGLLENTIVVISGDHGEEFLENGYVGHSSAFTPSQIKSPLILRLPKQSPKAFEHATSHYDVTATLMPYLGIVNPVSDYSHGAKLYDEDAQKDIVVCSWDRCAYIDDDGYFIFGTKSQTSFKIEFRDLDYEVISKKEGLSAQRNLKIPKILDRIGEYLN